MRIDSTGSIKIADRFLLPPNDPQGLLKWVYGDTPAPLPSSGTCSSDEYNYILEENIKYYSDKAILCPKNVDVDRLNDEMLKTLSGEGKVYYSADVVPVRDIDSDEGLYVITEFLNSINLSGLPPHLLSDANSRLRDRP